MSKHPLTRRRTSESFGDSRTRSTTPACPPLAGAFADKLPLILQQLRAKSDCRSEYRKKISNLGTIAAPTRHRSRHLGTRAKTDWSQGNLRFVPIPTDYRLPLP